MWKASSDVGKVHYKAKAWTLEANATAWTYLTRFANLPRHTAYTASYMTKQWCAIGLKLIAIQLSKFIFGDFSKMVYFAGLVDLYFSRESSKPLNVGTKMHFSQVMLLNDSIRLQSKIDYAARYNCWEQRGDGRSNPSHGQMSKNDGDASPSIVETLICHRNCKRRSSSKLKGRVPLSENDGVESPCSHSRSSDIMSPEWWSSSSSEFHFSVWYWSPANRLRCLKKSDKEFRSDKGLKLKSQTDMKRFLAESDNFTAAHYT